MLTKGLLTCLVAGVLQAQTGITWEFPNFPDRIQFMVQNPGDWLYNGVVVLRLAELKRRDPKFPGTLLLAAEDGVPVRGLATQTNRDEMAVEVHLKPHEKKTISLYYSTNLHDEPPVVTRVYASHNYGYNHATAAIESELMGYRTYGGFFFDVQAHAKGECGLFNTMIGYSSISHPPGEGQDIIHLGDTLGLGGLFLRAGGAVYRPSLSTPEYMHRASKPDEPTYKILLAGPLRAIIEESLSDWTVGADHVALRAIYEMDAGQEVIHCHWWLSPLKLTKSYEVGVGIRDLPGKHVTESSDVVTSEGVQEAAVGRIALGLGFGSTAKRAGTLKTPDGDNEIVVFHARLAQGQPAEGEYTFAAAWEGSGWNDPAVHVRESLQAQSRIVVATISDHETNPNSKALEAEPK